MNWSKPQPPTEGFSFYNHSLLGTPLGIFRIEWKGWEDQPYYSIQLDDKWVGVEYSLEDAKETAKKYIEDRTRELMKLLEIK